MTHSAKMAAVAAVDCTPSEMPHAWERSRWAWLILIPVLLAVSLAGVLTDPETSPRRATAAIALSVLMVGWFALLRPDLARTRGEDRRAAAWGLGTVVLWLPMVFVHGAFFLVLTGIFTSIFTNVDFRAARWLAALLGLEIALANVVFGGHTAADIVVTLAWVSGIIVGSVALASWVHGIIDESRDRHELIAQLEATRADLSAVERSAGVHQERARLTGEIHDTLAQSFTSLVLLLQAVESGIPAESPVRRQLGLAIDTAREGLDDARRLIADLDPEPLDAHSLPDAVRRVASRFTDETGVPTEVVVDGDHRRLAPNVEVALLRAAQESLANVRKHAEAQRVTIGLHFGPEVTLEVGDDGAGFDLEGPTTGFGLRGMRERLAAVNGRVQVASEPGHGTRVLVAVP